jgi:dephospho-CoA kinase
MKKNLKIAITGGIGSGKSIATTTAKDAGYFTLSADQITTELYQTERAKSILKTLFPDFVSSAGIDRAGIAKEVFSDKVKHAKLTDAITPLVMQEIQRRTSENQGVSIVEVPLLFECSYQNYFDKVIVIEREKEERIKSVMTRSNLKREQVIERMNNQIDYEAFDLTPYTVIENDCDILTFKQKILTAIKNLTE